MRIVADGRLFAFMRCTPWPKLLFFAGQYDVIGDDCCLGTAARIWLYGCSAQAHTEAFLFPEADVHQTVEDYAVFREAATRHAERSYERLMDRVGVKVLLPKMRKWIASTKAKHLGPAERGRFSSPLARRQST